MIKRSFFTLSGTCLNYDSVEPDLKEPTNIPVPPKLILLVNDPPSTTQKSLIKAKSKVAKGQKLLLYKESTEYTISPVSGTIKSIETYSDYNGNLRTYIIIESGVDDIKTSDETKPSENAVLPKEINPKEINPKEINYDLKETLSSADDYLRTLPGAPPLKQLTGTEGNIHSIVISGVDNDILSNTRQYVTLKFFNEVKQGALLLQKMTRATKVYLAIPETLNLPETASPLQVIKISLKYPSGLPALVLKKHLNMELPAGKSPEDLGVSFISAEAAVSIAHAYKAKAPVFEKILTVIGKKGKSHRVKAFIGTPLSKIFKEFDIKVQDQDRIIIGGPMRGFATYTIHHPVEPDMDTVIVQSNAQINELADNACINCGKCVRICPAGVQVNILNRNLEGGNYEEAADSHDLFSCIECGLCTYVCTAHIPLFQHIRLGKNKLLKTKADA